MSDEHEVRTMIESWARAVSAGDRAGILAHHSTDLLTFDFPATVQRLEAYDRTWDFFYANPLGPITFAPRDVKVVVASDRVLSRPAWSIAMEPRQARSTSG